MSVNTSITAMYYASTELELFQTVPDQSIGIQGRGVLGYADDTKKLYVYNGTNWIPQT